MLGRTAPEALNEYETAAAVLDAEGDLAGLAEAWIAIGVRRMNLGDLPAAIEALERAASCAEASGNKFAELDAAGWLVSAFVGLPVPADVAIGRAERYLQLQRHASSTRWRSSMVTPAASPTPARRSRVPRPRTPDAGRKSSRP
jgi:tetratricopeptide (TPR) repeat protein